MLHRIELIKKHAEMPKIVEDVHSLIHETIKEFSVGKSYEKLLKCSEEFENFFYKPKLFKTMKFAAYSNEIFKTFLGDYKCLVAACKESPDLFTLRDRLLCKTTIFNVLVCADLYFLMSSTSKCVQLVDLLPWEYVSIMENLESQLNIQNRFARASQGRLL